MRNTDYHSHDPRQDPTRCYLKSFAPDVGSDKCTCQHHVFDHVDTTWITHNWGRASKPSSKLSSMMWRRICCSEDNTTWRRVGKQKQVEFWAIDELKVVIHHPWQCLWEYDKCVGAKTTSFNGLSTIFEWVLWFRSGLRRKRWWSLRRCCLLV